MRCFAPPDLARWRVYGRALLPPTAAFTLITVAPAGCADRQPNPTDPVIADAASRLASEWTRVPADAPQLRARLAASPLAFFRFVNQAWTREVCAAFAADASSMPTARLHGDAHVEQYVVTADARGLDDFDDSARGPAVVDIVRFLGSLELAASQRGWTASLPATVDAFVAGYRRALEDPSYLPPDPAVVKRVRAASAKSALEFLSWTDSLMQPLSADELAQIDLSWQKIEALTARMNPEFTPATLTRKKVGWLHIGIGSALTAKVLIRIEGRTPQLDDDLVLEAKVVSTFEATSCVNVPASSEDYRVVEGLQQIGRLQQRLLVTLPRFVGPPPGNQRAWWVKAWDRTHGEVGIDALESPDELRELAHDAGAQLGSTNLGHISSGEAAKERLLELQATKRLEGRIRRVAHDLTAALVRAWDQGRH
jgi:Uncharacterized protein conserved in bacteria (DUF2252)